MSLLDYAIGKVNYLRMSRVTWAVSFLWVSSFFLMPAESLGQRSSLSEKIIVSPLSWGAKADGTTDDTGAWQAALDAVADVKGGILHVPEGRSVIAGSLRYSGDNLTVRGGATASVIVRRSDHRNLFEFVGDKLRFSDFLVDANDANGGALFRISAPNGNVWLDNILTNKGYNVVEFTAHGTPAQVFISNSIFNNFANDGISLGPNFGGQFFLNNVRLGCNPATSVGRGLHLDNGDTFHITNIDVTSCFYPIVLRPSPGRALLNVFLTNVTADGVGRTTGGAGIVVDGRQSNAMLRRVRLTNVWSGTNAGDGFLIANSDDVSLVNCISVTNKHHGLSIQTGSSNVKVIGSTFSGNSFGEPGLYSGIFVGDQVSDFVLLGNISRAIVGVRNSQKFGAEIRGASHERYIVQHNNLEGNVIGGLFWETTRKAIPFSGDDGAEVSGESSIFQATSVEIEHHLSLAPAKQNIQVTPLSDPGPNIRWWVSRVTESKFRLNTSAPSTFHFSWSVKSRR